MPYAIVTRGCQVRGRARCTPLKPRGCLCYSREPFEALVFDRWFEARYMDAEAFARFLSAVEVEEAGEARHEIAVFAPCDRPPRAEGRVEVVRVGGLPSGRCLYYLSSRAPFAVEVGGVWIIPRA